MKVRFIRMLSHNSVYCMIVIYVCVFIKVNESVIYKNVSYKNVFFKIVIYISVFYESIIYKNTFRESLIYKNTFYNSLFCKILF